MNLPGKRYDSIGIASAESPGDISLYTFVCSIGSESSVSHSIFETGWATRFDFGLIR